MFQPFQALPPYLGGKRKLVPLIFAVLNKVVSKRDWLGKKFVDPFFGGGAVSLYAKAQGLEVMSSDIALRSVTVGRALIENGAIKLAFPDVVKLCTELPGPFAHIAEEHFCPRVFTRHQAIAIDRMLGWVNSGHFDEVKSALLALLVIKAALRCQPMSMLTGTDAIRVSTEDYDSISPRRLGHYLRQEDLFTPTALWALATKVNRGVFPGRCRVIQADALNALRSTNGDIVYLDPPYPGTTDYESTYATLDTLLEGRTMSTSAFSHTSPPFAALLDACEHIPVWLISLGGPKVDLAKVLRLIEGHRTVASCHEIPYPHLKSLRKGAAHESREYIVAAC